MFLLRAMFDVIANLTGFIVDSRPIDRRTAPWAANGRQLPLD
jgi:hypothetical protein